VRRAVCEAAGLRRGCLGRVLLTMKKAAKQSSSRVARGGSMSGLRANTAQALRCTVRLHGRHLQRGPSLRSGGAAATC
jgi:hypothetical protein